MTTIALLTEDLLDAIPEGARFSDVMEALNFVHAAMILQASEGDIAQETRLLQVIQSDLGEKVHGVAQ